MPFARLISGVRGFEIQAGARVEISDMLSHVKLELDQICENLSWEWANPDGRPEMWRVKLAIDALKKVQADLTTTSGEPHAKLSRLAWGLHGIFRGWTDAGSAEFVVSKQTNVEERMLKLYDLVKPFSGIR